MAGSTIDVQDNRQIDGASHPPMQETEPVNTPRYARGHLLKDYDECQVHQKIQIEKEILRFLMICVTICTDSTGASVKLHLNQFNKTYRVVL